MKGILTFVGTLILLLLGYFAVLLLIAATKVVIGGIVAILNGIISMIGFIFQIILWVLTALIVIGIPIAMIYGLYHFFSFKYPELSKRKKELRLKNETELEQLRLEKVKVFDEQQTDIIKKGLANEVVKLEHEREKITSEISTIYINEKRLEIQGRMEEEGLNQKKIETKQALIKLQSKQAKVDKKIMQQKEALRLEQAQTDIEIQKLHLSFESDEYQLRLKKAEIQAEMANIPLKKSLEIKQLEIEHLNKSESEKYAIAIDKRRLLLQEFQAVSSELQIASNLQGVNQAKQRIFEGLKSELLDTNLLIDLYEKDRA